MAINEFQVESHISSKQLNNQSVSLIVPRLTRDKIHNSMYYKVNLSNESLRGNTMVELLKVIVGTLGTSRGQDGHLHMVVLGGVEFKCILMKLIEIRPNFEQLNFCLLYTSKENKRRCRANKDNHPSFATMLISSQPFNFILGGSELSRSSKRNVRKKPKK